MSLRISYKRLSVLNGSYQGINFTSAASSFIALMNNLASSTGNSGSIKTKILSSSQVQSNVQYRKKLSDADKASLRESIVNNGFFQTKGFYPPDPMGPQDYMLSILCVSMDREIHTVLWSDTSIDVPSGLNSIVKKIQEIVSK